MIWRQLGGLRWLDMYESVRRYSTVRKEEAKATILVCNVTDVFRRDALDSLRMRLHRAIPLAHVGLLSVYGEYRWA